MAGNRLQAGLRIATALALAIVGLSILAPSHADARPKRGAYIIVDMKSGVVLSSRRSRAPMRPASLTKMMTLYLTFEALRDGRLRWNQVLTASRTVAAAPRVHLGLRRGDKITVGAAVLATAIRSANDAAVLLAEALGGSEARFAKMMTVKARMLGMRSTRFRTASGLDARGHISTARDMAVLARRLYLDFPKRYRIFRRTSMTYRGRRYGATNSTLGRGGVDGMKTGFTYRAGYNLAASAKRGDRRVLVVLLGGRTRTKRDRAVLRLMDKGFRLLAKLNRRRSVMARHRLEHRRTVAPIMAPKPVANPKRAIMAATRASDLASAVALGAYETASVPAPAVERDAAVDAAAIGESVAAKLARAEMGKPRITPSAASSHKWAVQIGAFMNPKRAAALMRKVVRRRPRAVAGAFRSIQQVRLKTDGRKLTVHRVRFTGMTQTAAASLCEKMQRTGAPCAVVPPEGWRGQGG
ncbi:MAG: D-alanyl-D-alanine carboxypeptidase [Neomegalonema sp.]|nr:D-alanyl-D-alanine carboxypeptidase [Neomegalonema sp.]